MVRALLCPLVLIWLAPPAVAHACTAAAVAPGGSARGRPILWKHRDTRSQHNEVVVRDDGKYRYVGVINAGDEVAREIWGGVNEAGLAVMNTASGDLMQPEEPTDGEGRLLKLLLQACASLAEVEALLRLTDRGGRDVTTNIGVIDAAGGAAFFEVGPKTFERFDAKDDDGDWIVRTNFALSGPGEHAEAGGYIRYARARELFAAERAQRELTPEFILLGPSVDLSNAKTGVDPRRASPPGQFIITRDTINRFASVSDMVFETAKQPEPPHASVMWVALGQPLAALAVPVWPVPQVLPPDLNGVERAGLELLSDRIRLALYPEQHGNLEYYMDAELALAVRAILDAEQQKIFVFVRGEREALGAKKQLTAEKLIAITQEATVMARAGLERALAAVAPTAR